MEESVVEEQAGKNLLSPRWRRTSSLAKTDRRSRRTRNALTAALISLLREKPLSAITVTELTALADVNRATFYTHYQDVFDMYDQMKNEICETFAELIEAHADEIRADVHEPLLTDVFRYFEDNSNLLSMDIVQNASAGFFDEVCEVLSACCLNAIVPSDADDDTRMLFGYQFDFICTGIVGVLRGWLAGGKREPVELMVGITANLMEPLDERILNRNQKLLAQ